MVEKTEGVKAERGRGTSNNKTRCSETGHGESHAGYTSPLDACQCSAHALARPHSGMRTRIHGQGRRRDERAGTNRDASLRSRLRARRARCRWLTSWPLGGSGCVPGGSLWGKRLCRRQLRTCTCCDEQQADRVRGIPQSILGGQRARRVTTHASIVNNGPIPHSSTMAGARPHRRRGCWLVAGTPMPASVCQFGGTGLMRHDARPAVTLALD